MNLAAFDEKWYPMLASRAIGERELGHDASAERWEELCRDFRALAEGDALDPGLLLVRVQEAERALREAAQRWRDHAAESRAEGHVSSMGGEEGIPSHVISTARAISFDGAADTVRAVLGGDVQEQETEGQDD